LIIHKKNIESLSNEMKNEKSQSLKYVSGNCESFLELLYGDYIEIKG